MSNSLWPHGLQRARPPFPSPTPGVYSNSCLLSQWHHPIISSSVVPFSCLQSFPASVFSDESALRLRWTKSWSFSFNISPSNEYSGLISFRMGWLDILEVQGTLKSLLQHHSSKALILQHLALFIVQLFLYLVSFNCIWVLNSLTGINVFSCNKIYWGEMLFFLEYIWVCGWDVVFLFLFSLKLSVTRGCFLFQALLYLG